MELLTGESISHIASAIGIPLYMDKATEQRRRIDFARVCIEICSEDELPDTIEVSIEDAGVIDVKVEYPCKPKLCSICSKFSFGEHGCHKGKKLWNYGCQ